MKLGSPLTLQVAARIRAMRKDRGWSARELADATAAAGYPITQATIANIERGTRLSVSIDELDALARALETTPNRLLAWYDAGGLGF